MFEPPWPESVAEDMEALQQYEDLRQSLSAKSSAAKKWFYRTQWIATLSGVILIGLGAAQAGLEADSPVIIVLQSLIGLAAGAFVLFGRELNWQREWLGSRAASEALKHEFFYFLGRVGEYGEVDDPVLLLRKRVRAIERELEEFVSLRDLPQEAQGEA